jgi:hypothetical protein
MILSYNLIVIDILLLLNIEYSAILIVDFKHSYRRNVHVAVDVNVNTTTFFRQLIWLIFINNK